MMSDTVLRMSVSVIVASAALAGGAATAQAEAARKPIAGESAAPAAPASETPKAGGYEVTRVRRQNMPEYFPAVGALGAWQTTQVGSQVSGILAEVLVDVGDVVTQNQPLAKIDTSFISIELDQRKAELKSAQVRVAQAKQRWERIHKLFGTGVDPIIAEQTLDDTRADYDVAQSQLAMSALAVRFAEQRMKEATILAPYAGIITKRMADPGQPVATAPATHILELQQVDKLEMLFPLPQENFGLVKVGSPVHYQVSGAELSGDSTVDRVYPEIDRATRSFLCRAVVENPTLRLAPGLLVQVGVVRREVKNALVLPRSAIFQTPRGDAVRVPKGDSYEEKPVKTGVATLETIEIVEGLAEGDEVLLLRAEGAAAAVESAVQ